MTLGLSIATTLAFNEVLPLAGRLMIPYVAWMAFANLLNFEIWRLNVPGHAAESKQVRYPCRFGLEAGVVFFYHSKGRLGSFEIDG